jgi:polysaccharide deacetylase 2 family uncharacterized protein YibQ
VGLFSLFTTKKKKTKKKKTRKKTTRKKGKSGSLYLILGIVLVAIISGVGILKWSASNSGQAALLAMGSEKMYGKVQFAVETALEDVLPAFKPGAVGAADGLRAEDYDWPAPEFGPASSIRCRLVEVDAATGFWDIQLAVEEAITAAGASVLWSERLFPSELSRQQTSPNEELDFLRMDLGVSGKPTHTLILHRPEARGTVRWGAGSSKSLWTKLVQDGQGPVIALVIDDWGYKKNDTTRRLLGIKAPLTMAVLPDLSFSRHFALLKTDLVLPPGSLASGLAASDVESGVDLRRGLGCLVNVSLDNGRVSLPAKRRETILHLPMQPQGYPRTNPGEGALLVGMGSAEIEIILANALDGLPNLTGVNNHMGSAATSDRPTMKAFMEILAGRGLLFLDSLTTSGSVAYEEARGHGIPALKNRIFLDYDNESHKQVKTNLQKLVRSAKATGFAVGIGHPHAVTADVLVQEIPRLQAQGIRFVTVSEMVALKDLARSRQGK